MHIYAKARRVQLPIPGGCTNFAQPADVSRNKPFKSVIRAMSDHVWMMNGKHSFTPSGYMRQPPSVRMCEWIDAAWQRVSA